MYTRNTELRHLQHKHIYELSMILDEKDAWIKLMEVIPKGINNQDLHSESFDKALTANGPKYNNNHIRLTEEASKSLGQSKSEILLEEWGISGRKHERPTLGVLLLLLVKVELFRAADFISINLLKESPQKRPNKGLAASVNTSLPSELFGEIEQMLNDCELYPSTGELKRQDDNVFDNNRDYYTKHYELIEKQILTNENSPPKPPPRRGMKLQKQQKQQQRDIQRHLIDSKTGDNKNEQFEENCVVNNTTHEPSHLTNTSLVDTSLPNLSILNKDDKVEQPQESFLNNYTDDGQIARLSSLITNNSHTKVGNVRQEKAEEIPSHSQNNVDECIPRLSVLLLSDVSDQDFSHNEKENSQIHHSENVKDNELSNNYVKCNDDEDEPGLKALLLNSHQCSGCNETEQVYINSIEDPLTEESGMNHVVDGDIDDDDDDEDDNSMPNLSIFDQASSNYDSSLTNVTGTSGENSFDLSVGSSAASVDNIPCVSGQKQ